jgi:hypothetical protein
MKWRAAALRPATGAGDRVTMWSKPSCRAVGHAASGAGRDLPERSNPIDGAFEFHTLGRTANLNDRCLLMRASLMGQVPPGVTSNLGAGRGHRFLRAREQPEATCGPSRKRVLVTGSLETPAIWVN